MDILSGTTEEEVPSSTTLDATSYDVDTPKFSTEGGRKAPLRISGVDGTEIGSGKDAEFFQKGLISIMGGQESTVQSDKQDVFGRDLGNATVGGVNWRHLLYEAGVSENWGKYGYDKKEDNLQRNDGTEKGSGFLGILKNSTGEDVTEYAVGIEIDGKETEVPTLVPSLTPEEVSEVLLASEGKGTLSDTIIQKAADHAADRIKSGLSPFAVSGDMKQMSDDERYKWYAGKTQSSNIEAYELLESGVEPSSIIDDEKFARINLLRQSLQTHMGDANEGVLDKEDAQAVVKELMADQDLLAAAQKRRWYETARTSNVGATMLAAWGDELTQSTIRRQNRTQTLDVSPSVDTSYWGSAKGGFIQQFNDKVGSGKTDILTHIRGGGFGKNNTEADLDEYIKQNDVAPDVAVRMYNEFEKNGYTAATEVANLQAISDETTTRRTAIDKKSGADYLAHMLFNEAAPYLVDPTSWVVGAGVGKVAAQATFAKVSSPLIRAAMQGGTVGTATGLAESMVFTANNYKDFSNKELLTTWATDAGFGGAFGAVFAAAMKGVKNYGERALSKAAGEGIDDAAIGAVATPKSTQRFEENVEFTIREQEDAAFAEREALDSAEAHSEFVREVDATRTRMDEMQTEIATELVRGLPTKQILAVSHLYRRRLQNLRKQNIRRGTPELNEEVQVTTPVIQKTADVELQEFEVKSLEVSIARDEALIAQRYKSDAELEAAGSKPLEVEAMQKSVQVGVKEVAEGPHFDLLVSTLLRTGEDVSYGLSSITRVLGAASIRARRLKERNYAVPRHSEEEVLQEVLRQVAKLDVPEVQGVRDNLEKLLAEAESMKPAMKESREKFTASEKAKRDETTKIMEAKLATRKLALESMRSNPVVVRQPTPVTVELEVAPPVIPPKPAPKVEPAPVVEGKPKTTPEAEETPVDTRTPEQIELEETAWQDAAVEAAIEHQSSVVRPALEQVNASHNWIAKVHRALGKSIGMQEFASKMIFSTDNKMSYIGTHILETGAGFSGKFDRPASAALIKDSIYTRNVGNLNRAYVDNIQGWAMQQGVGTYKRWKAAWEGGKVNDVAKAFHREVFKHQEMLQMGKKPAANEFIEKYVKQLNKTNDELFNGRIDANVKGFDAERRIPNYIPHVWKKVKVAEVIRRHGENVVLELITKSIESAKRHGKIADATSTRELAERQLNWINGLGDSMEHAGGDLISGRAKSRIPLDFSVDHNGLHMVDLIDTDLPSVMDSYIQRAGADIGISKATGGLIRSEGDFVKYLTPDSAEGKLLAQDAKDMLYGRPTRQGMSPEMRSMMDIVTIQQMGGIGVAQLAETGTMAQRLIVNYVSQPEIAKKLWKAAGVSTNDKGILHQIRSIAAINDNMEYINRYSVNNIDQAQIDELSAYRAASIDAVDKVTLGAYKAQFGRLLGSLSGVNAVQKAQSRLLQASFSVDIARAAKFGKGTSTEARLIDLGLKADSKAFEQIRKYVEFDADGFPENFNFDKWDKDGLDQFVYAMNREEAQLMPRVMAGELPVFMNKPIWQAIMQFRKTPLAFMSKGAQRNMQFADREAVVGTVLNSLTAGVTRYAKVALGGAAYVALSDAEFQSPTLDQAQPYNYVSNFGILGDAYTLGGSWSRAYQQKDGIESLWEGAKVVPVLSAADNAYHALDGDPSAIKKAMPLNTLPLINEVANAVIRNMEQN